MTLQNVVNANALSTVTMFAVNHDSFLSVTLIMKFSSLPQETIETDGRHFNQFLTSIVKLNRALCKLGMDATSLSFRELSP